MSFSFKQLVMGKPIATERASHERLPKVFALPIFASDAISSNAYATQEILLALTLAVGFAAQPGSIDKLRAVLPVAIAIGVLLVIVALSYIQTIFAYPDGGGSYRVAKENLGETPGLIAAASLMIDYVLTVAVSTAAGMDAVTSAFPELQPQAVPLCIVIVALITVVNLRGVRESGAIFAIPTYLFILSLGVMLVLGFTRYFTGNLATYAPLTAQSIISNPHFEALSFFVILRAFASGCSALTGIEAIANGVPVFYKPESKNAAITLGMMAGILITLFLSISALTFLTGVHPIFETHTVNGIKELVLHNGQIADPSETIISVLAHISLDGGAMSWFYYVLQFATALILFLAANTSFAGFPRLVSILAEDRYMPRQLTNLGDRLVYNNGIIILALVACAVIAVFNASVTSMIALYAVGVFVAFTLSQCGMVVHWWHTRGKHWKTSATINALGAIATLIVSVIIASTKFASGAWMVVIAIPLIVLAFRRISAHYKSVAKQLSLEDYRPAQGIRHHVLVLAPDIHRGVIPALQFARSISDDARAVHVAINPDRTQRVEQRWRLYARGVPLTILPSPYRSLVDPVIDYIDRLQRQDPRSNITFIVPEFVPSGILPKFLHGQTGLLLGLRLRLKPGVVFISIPYHIEAYIDLPPGFNMEASKEDLHESTKSQGIREVLPYEEEPEKPETEV
ncbi:MAG: APC family permease [Abditibacteriaceae bacterium]